MASVSHITPENARKMAQDGTGLLVDVRTVGEVLGESLPGSVYLPFDLVNAERLAGMGVQGKKPILVCRSGTRAVQAAESLAQEMGDVAVLDEGIAGWKKAGLPVDEGKKGMPIERQVLVGAGAMVFLFTLLGLLVSSFFFAFALFIGCGLMFAGFTGTCGMARVLVMMPWNKAPLGGCGASCAVGASAAGTAGTKGRG